jgi:hypothetical protein
VSERVSMRREALKKAEYVPTAIPTLAALPSFASAGSGRNNSHTGHQGGGEEHHHGRNRRSGNNPYTGRQRGEERHQCGRNW